MKTSVVVPTYQRPAFAARTIKSLAEQSYPPREIIAVDNEPSEETAAMVRDLRREVRGLRYVAEPRLGVCFARNRGAEEAGGELVAFIDDDAVASPTWLQGIVETLRAAPDAVAAAGPIGLRWPRAAPSWVAGLEGWYGQFSLGPDVATIDYPRYPFASNLAFRREAFLSVGGFPLELGPRGSHRISNEEDGLFRRVNERGWTVAYARRAVVYHWVHDERVSRRYLFRRSALHGQSDVLVDAMFNQRSRRERARRSFDALGDALEASRVAVTRRREGKSVAALVTVGTELGRATRHAALSVQLRRDAPNGSREREIAPGLSVEQQLQFERDGFVRVPGAFRSADAMTDRMWEFLARRGIARDDPDTWPCGKSHHLQKLLKEAVFMPIGGPGTSAAIDHVLGAGRWTRPEHWGEFLVNFPEPGRQWNVPALWHTDAAYSDPLAPPLGVMVFSFLNRVEPRGGSTLVLAGSHRLVARLVMERPDVARLSTAAARRAFYQSHPWLTDLITDETEPTRRQRFAVGADIDGIPVRLVELTGDPGDVVIAHPLIAHCVSPNCARQPRFMRIARPRLRAAERDSGS